MTIWKFPDMRFFFVESNLSSANSMLGGHKQTVQA
jgi:hypothetical protein